MNKFSVARWVTVLFVVSFFMLACFTSCNVVKQSECKKKFVNVTVISAAGVSVVQVPYCDTIYIGNKPTPDSLAVRFVEK